MDAYREEFARIKDLLKKNPQGMSVTEIARELDRNKHSMGRYLDILHALGDV
jgi:DNA-binding IclR family transcriptional regulator